jgi:hypothetical protein
VSVEGASSDEAISSILRRAGARGTMTQQA